MKQIFEKYTEQDHLVWKTLFDRQIKNLDDKACYEYKVALKELEDVLNRDKIVKFNDLNESLLSKTGWSIEVVKGLIPVELFFDFLSRKKFCSSTWLRTMEQLDYLEEPDMFHDIFGHVPLLVNDVFASFMEEFGKLGVSCLKSPEKVVMLQRLYWFTIEFGLIGELRNKKIYGAGIISSFGETNHAMQGNVEYKSFDLDKIMNTNFRTDEIQNFYYVIPSFEELFEAIEKCKFNGVQTTYSIF